jgi:soluble lytic murein transglycosylase
VSEKAKVSGNEWPIHWRWFGCPVVERIIGKYRWWLFGLIALGIGATFLQRWLDRREQRQDRFIFAAAQKYGVPAALVKAVVWRESRFDPGARGTKGELGLMQIRNEAGQEWAQAEQVALYQHRLLLDPEQNTLAGTWYLGKLLRRYAPTDNPVPYALADYNAGRTNVRRWIKGEASTRSGVFLSQIDFPTTRQYIDAVMKRYRYYEKKWEGEKSGGR